MPARSNLPARRPGLDRRRFLAGSAMLLAAPALLGGRSLAATDAVPPASAAHPLAEGWLTTAGVDDGFAAVAVDGTFEAATRAASAVRLHGLEANPEGTGAVAVGRRPGHVALLFDRNHEGVTARFEPGAGRVFAGHGRFTADGRHFLTTEIERPPEGDGPLVMGRGIVARRDVAADFAIVGEWPTGGDGPHDLLQSGASLVVANGGIEPNTPEARDAAATGSTITLLDPATGALKAEGRLPKDLASLSLRHLARDGRGGTVVAAQDLLHDGVARPLLYTIGPDGALAALDAPEDEWRALRGYVGSVAFDRSGRYVACSSPRGGRVALWRADGRYLGAVRLIDGCGLAGMEEAGRFVATSGYGETIVIGISDDEVGIIARHSGGPRFDNHMVRLTPNPIGDAAQRARL